MASPIDMTTLAPGDLQHKSKVKRASWLSLPLEIKLRILEELTTVDELRALDCSSKGQCNVFKCYGVQILENNLEDDAGPWIRNVIYATFNLLAQDSRDWSYTELRHIDSFAPRQHLSREATPEFVRKFVSLARKIHVIAQVMLKNPQGNLVSLWEKLAVNNFNPECPETNACTLSEETRAIMGLWLCQLYDVVRKAYGEDDLRLVRRTRKWIPSDLPVYKFFRRRWCDTLVAVAVELSVMGYDLSVWDKPCD